MSNHANNTHIVYRVMYGRTEYLQAIGRTSDTCLWTPVEVQALRMPKGKARNLAKKFNDGIDGGARRPYGYDLTYTYYP